MAKEQPKEPAQEQPRTEQPADVPQFDLGRHPHLNPENYSTGEAPPAYPHSTAEEEAAILQQNQDEAKAQLESGARSQTVAEPVAVEQPPEKV